MKGTSKLLLESALAVVLAIASTPAAAQDAPFAREVPPTPAEGTPAPTLAQVEADLAAIEADTTIDDAEKQSLSSTYREAIAALKESEKLDAQAQGYRGALVTAPEEASALRSQQEALESAESAEAAAAAGSADQLESELLARKASLAELKDTLARTGSELARVRGRPVEISSRLPEAERELSELRRQLASPRLSGDEQTPSRKAERILLQARVAKLSSESRKLEQEQASQAVREELLRAREQLLTRQVENAAAVVAALEAMAGERLSEQAQRAGAIAESIPEAGTAGDADAEALAAEVRALARQLQTVVAHLDRVREARGQVAARMERLTGRYESTREQLALGAGGRGLAQVLLDLRRRHPPRLGAVAAVPTLDDSRIAALEVRAMRRRQSDVESRFEGDRAEALAPLVRTRGEVLEQLEKQYGRLTRDLAALEGERRQYADKALEVHAWIGEQLFGFGMRSAPPISVATLTQVPAGLRWLVQREHGVELRRATLSAITRAPVAAAGFVLLLIGLLVPRHRIVAALERTGKETHRVATDRYALTGEALGWTVLLAAPLPLAVGAVTWACTRDREPNDWLRGFAEGLEIATVLVLGLALLAQLCRPGGLGAVHFRWQERSLERFRQALLGFGAVYVPLLLVTFSGIFAESDEPLFGVGRLGFMLAHAWAAFVFWRLFEPSSGILASRMRKHPRGPVARWRYLWFPLTVTLPLALVVIAGLGYVYTSIRAAQGMLATAALVAGGAVLFSLVLRWFRIKQRRLAVAERLERQRARAEAAAQEEQPGRSVDVVAVDPEAEEELDLDSIVAQTAELLRLAISLGVALMALAVWSGWFPIVATLESIPFPLLGLSLLELAQAALIAVATYIGVVNLPGLLEMVALRTSAVDAGTRYAISSLCQYALIAIGLTALFNVLRIDWAKLGWIAAALSVGIGFGLQEVFANFVCGLIVLFERPIRIGDFVTVAGVTGTVTKIRIRATTITNGERQEFVVPNKTLITSSLLNWTRNSSVNRISINVGIAGDADPDQALRLLLDVAREHPVVLDEPAPRANFATFGDSTLNLILYAYLPTIDSRVPTTSELHSEIHRRFAAAGIEIPNPQLDLHHRSEAESAAVPEPARSGRS